MLRLGNALLHATHLAVICFSCVGWIWPETRPWHLALAAGIAVSWFVIGPLLGDPGYCVVTGAQHALWRRLGHTEQPNYMSFLYARLTGRPPDSARIGRWTQGTFYATTTLSLALTCL
ncbi:MAG: DUF2784 family protein [Planctomycetota bacterium]